MAIIVHKTPDFHRLKLTYAKFWRLGIQLWLLVIVLAACKFTPSEDTEHSLFLNHHDSAQYVGMHVCRECHPLIWESYVQTGMGRSFAKAGPTKSKSVLDNDAVLFDSHSNLYYKPYWADTLLMVMEFRLGASGDTLHKRSERVDYIVGSGNHTNSHIFSINGYAFQIPFTYYTQVQKLDLPPGFEGGHNSRFSRSLGLECIACHNGYPNLVVGSENKYAHMPEGIDCERCHGPGSIHVALKKKGILIDTSRFADYSIVNPKWLSIPMQNDVCARCHLQGTIVLKEGKSFYDFKPGMELTKVMDIFMPVFEGGKEDLIMASHVERLSESRCFIASNGQISCMQCHNPHIPIQQHSRSKLNSACINCHSQTASSQCKHPQNLRELKSNDCANCHMPRRDSRDIPHVLITDHKIVIPGKIDKGVRVFKGLKAVNNSQSSPFIKARAYLREFETYHPNPVYLDSAAHYLRPKVKKTDAAHFKAYVQYYFLRGKTDEIIRLVKTNSADMVLDKFLTQQQFDNEDAWTAYRIGQAYSNADNKSEALLFFEKAVLLAPLMHDFQQKYGAALLLEGRTQEARRVFARIVNENPRNDMGWVNLGYTELLLQNRQQALESYTMALRLNPDNVQALLNLAGYYMISGLPSMGVSYLQRVLVIDPQNHQARTMLSSLRQS